MSERPILFSGPMVRAILEGRKTQTRRVIKKQPHGLGGWAKQLQYWFFPNVAPFLKIKCPYGIPGDRLWVRETWKTDSDYDPCPPSQIDSGAAVLWLTDGTKKLNGPESWGKVRPSIHMPRWASRITLEVTGVRVERLQEIDNDCCMTDAATVKEGCPVEYIGSGEAEVSWFRNLWDSINGKKYPWESNPWVWVIEFNPPGKELVQFSGVSGEAK